MAPKPLSRTHRIWPPRKEAADSTVANALEVSKIDMCIAENGKDFHTARYEVMTIARHSKQPTQLVVRRGAPFTVKLVCDRAYEPAVDTIVLILSVDPFGSETINYGSGTEVGILVETPTTRPEDSDGDGWIATLKEGSKQSDGRVAHTVHIVTPANASVGKYNMEVHTRLDTKDITTSFRSTISLYLLFNAWCERDDVYMEGEKLRQEYVLNDSTMIWRQEPKKEGMVSWNVGQYEEDILDCALWVIAVTGRVPATFRGNPVRVTRALTGALNINNGPGVLQGRWDGNYSDGTSPLAWSGSVRILQEFYNGGMQAIKYGQCWVYSGLLATVCRAVGIPCRIVTNFNSAHDGDCSLTVDYYVDPSGDTVGSMSSDSIWNYHVWNEAWMVRSDLGQPEYNGWQAVDATPQELSDGMFKSGPAPVAAVKNGKVHVAFDTEFVFSEVNADKTYWATRGDNSLPKLLMIDTKDVGQNISTKAVGVNDREDITNAYKHREGTPEERQVMADAIKLGSQRFSSCSVARKLLEPHEATLRQTVQANKVTLVLESTKTNVLGESFGMKLIVRNTLAHQAVNVVGTLTLKHTDYTGRRSQVILQSPIDLSLRELQSRSIILDVLFSDYNNPAFEQTHILVMCVLEVPGTYETFFVQKTFPLAMPSLKMALVDERSTTGTFVVRGTFRNPLPIPLTAGRFVIEGSSHTKPLEELHEIVGVGETVSFAYRLNMAYTGPTVVSARFVSLELKNIHGHLELDLSRIL